MFSASTVPAATINAYLAADYQVIAAELFVLKVGRPSHELAQWFKRKECNSAAFITAWNPMSEQKSDLENHAAQQALAAEIKARGLPYLEGEGKDPAGEWPGEPSLLVFGISLESAKKLALRFCQNGFIYAGGNATPRLILLR